MTSFTERYQDILYRALSGHPLHSCLSPSSLARCFHPARTYIIVYIFNAFAVIVVPVGDELEKSKLATVAWEGDSREVLRSFPTEVTQNLGFQLWQLQQGERPTDYRSLPSVGAGVFELRDQDERARYRVVYLSRIGKVVYVLHCFEKKGREMPRRDFEIARKRLKSVKARLTEEKKREKRS